MQDVGRILREERMARGFEISEVARRTCISLRYLKAMEEGRFNVIPNVFDRGYLKIYAKYLNIDATPLLALLDQKKAGTTAVQMQAL
ncbi:MAG: helix-turn-helix domain-containing protein [Nitrospirota bacterium]|nr:helix-turn-helix domain-containing protein [Nitrospirota bacterium]